MTGVGWVVIIFLLFLTGVGVWHARRIKTAEDFSVAGRGFGVFVLSGTLISTWIGTGSLFSSAEKAYETGIAILLLPIAGCLGIVVLSFLAPKARATQALTVPRILGERFGLPAQWLGSIALILAYLIIVSYQYRAGAAIASFLFPDLDAMALRIGVASFIILYTALAGMHSVAWTDVVNGIVLSTGVLVALAYMMTGWASDSTPATPPTEAWHSFAGGPDGIGWAGILLPSFLLVLGDANLHQRFMSAKSPAVARRAAVMMFFGVLVLELAIIGLALYGRLRLPADLGDEAAKVIITMGFDLLPAAIGTLLAATAFAVIISTADSYLLGSATSLSADFTRRDPKPNFQRALVVVLGVTAFGISLLSSKYFSIAIYAYTLYGASLTPAIICALVRPRTPRGAIVGSMATGLGVAIAWKVLADNGVLSEGLAEIEAVLPAISGNLLVLVVLAIVLPDQDERSFGGASEPSDRT